MSTRRATEGQPLRQERFASTETRRGILANLVSHRVQTLTSAEDRELIWWLQELSLRDLDGAHFACTSFPAWPNEFLRGGDSSLERLAAQLCEGAASCRQLADFLKRLCLDPNCYFDDFKGREGLRTMLLGCKARFEASYRSFVAPTTVDIGVREALDFCLSQRGITLMEGTYRSGKSFSAQSWCLERPGRARYVSLSAYTDETSFFRLIARSVGSASGVQRKAQEIRQRIEESLRGRDLMLVIDECEYLLPGVARPTAEPSRLNYLMADLDNRGIAVALIGSRNFTRKLANIERRLATYGAEQFYGRLAQRKQLPDTLSENELSAVAERVLPDSTEPARMLLVGHALTAKGRIGALEHTARRARFFAEQGCRSVAFDDIERAIVESESPSLPQMPRGASAKRSQGRGSDHLASLISIVPRLANRVRKGTTRPAG